VITRRIPGIAVWWRWGRQRFWLLVMDVIVLCGGFGSRAYGWTLQRASDATDWGDGEDCSGEDW
jgi:hypothetical protein